jgi:hypothetical protein
MHSGICHDQVAASRIREHTQTELSLAPWEPKYVPAGHAAQTTAEAPPEATRQTAA